MKLADTDVSQFSCLLLLVEEVKPKGFEKINQFQLFESLNRAASNTYFQYKTICYLCSKNV